MKVAVQHTISDVDGFWGMADKELANLPEGLALLSALPSPDGATCNCMWEAESVDAMQSYMDEKFGPFAKNLCYEVAEDKAIGLPG